MRSGPITVVSLFRESWNAGRDTQALRMFIEARGLSRLVRAFISSLTLVVTTVAILSLGSPSGAQGIIDRVVVVICIAGGIGWTVRWNVSRWPSFRESIAFLVFADIAITVVCFLDSNSLAGLSGAGLLVLLGTYATFLLGPRVLYAHVVWCCVSIAILAGRVAMDPQFDLAIAAAKSIMLFVVGAAVPVLIELGVHLIRVDADMSITDPLTGLSNRRGLERRLLLLIDDAPSRTLPPLAAVIVLDLDKFKAVNDKLGHNVGDEVLIRVGRSITAVSNHTAVIARHGGEEFLVFDMFADADAAHDCARAVRDAVASAHLPDEGTTYISSLPVVTASVGLATMPTAELLGDADRAGPALASLVDRGDAAMYRAKRAGGHCVVADQGPEQGLKSSA
ncbi:MAG: GGDEF domain-containing protein [Rhodococcus sp. (in: high G+C Gram-positive bacteria)]